MATGKDASRVGAESRWHEGSFGAGLGANDYAVGTPQGVEAARALKLEPHEIACCVEASLDEEGGAMGPQSKRPDE